MFQAFLGEVAGGRAAGILDMAGIGLDLPGEEAQKGRLAGTVLATQADPVTEPDMPVDPSQNSL